MVVRVKHGHISFRRIKEVIVTLSGWDIVYEGTWIPRAVYKDETVEDMDYYEAGGGSESR